MCMKVVSFLCALYSHMMEILVLGIGNIIVQQKTKEFSEPKASTHVNTAGKNYSSEYDSGASMTTTQCTIIASSKLHDILVASTTLLSITVFACFSCHIVIFCKKMYCKVYPNTQQEHSVIPQSCKTCKNPNFTGTPNSLPSKAGLGEASSSQFKNTTSLSCDTPFITITPKQTNYSSSTSNLSSLKHTPNVVRLSFENLEVCINKNVKESTQSPQTPKREGSFINRCSNEVMDKSESSEHMYNHLCFPSTGMFNVSQSSNAHFQSQHKLGSSEISHSSSQNLHVAESSDAHMYESWNSLNVPPLTPNKVKPCNYQEPSKNQKCVSNSPGQVQKGLLNMPTFDSVTEFSPPFVSGYYSEVSKCTPT